MASCLLLGAPEFSRSGWNGFRGQGHIQTPVGIKVKGPNVDHLAVLSGRIEGLLRGFPGTQSVIAERYYIDVQHDLERMAAEGVTRRRGDADGPTCDRRREHRQR